MTLQGSRHTDLLKGSNPWRTKKLRTIAVMIIADEAAVEDRTENVLGILFSVIIPLCLIEPAATWLDTFLLLLASNSDHNGSAPSFGMFPLVITSIMLSTDITIYVLLYLDVLLSFG